MGWSALIPFLFLALMHPTCTYWLGTALHGRTCTAAAVTHGTLLIATVISHITYHISHITYHVGEGLVAEGLLAVQVSQCPFTMGTGMG